MLPYRLVSPVRPHEPVALVLPHGSVVRCCRTGVCPRCRNAVFGIRQSDRIQGLAAYPAIQIAAGLRRSGAPVSGDEVGNAWTGADHAGCRADIYRAECNALRAADHAVCKADGGSMRERSRITPSAAPIAGQCVSGRGSRRLHCRYLQSRFRSLGRTRGLPPPAGNDTKTRTSGPVFAACPLSLGARCSGLPAGLSSPPRVLPLPDPRRRRRRAQSARRSDAPPRRRP